MAEAKLILVHTEDPYGDELWINAANIQTVTPLTDPSGSYTEVKMMNGEVHPVRETPVQIQAKIVN